MKDKKSCEMKGCFWSRRHQVLGLILLVLGLILTLKTHSDAGIAALVIVGGIMCCHRHLRAACQCGCCNSCGGSDNACEPMCNTESKTPRKVAPRKKTA